MPRAKTARKPTPAVTATPVAVETPEQMLARLRLLTVKAERAKKVYGQIDELTFMLAQREQLPATIKAGKKTYAVKMVDRYSVKNVQWKNVAMKRWEVEFEEVE